MPKNTTQRIIDSARGVSGSGGTVVYAGSSGGGSVTGDYVPITRAVLAGAGLAVSPADGVLDEDLTLSLAASAAGAGLSYIAGVLAVVPGEGLEIETDAIGLAASVAGAALSYNAGVLAVVPGEGLEIETDAIGLAATVAGSGLAYAAGVLNVGVSGLGLGVGADAVTLTSSNNPGAAASILASSAAGLLTLYNGMFTQAAQSAATFASGFAGSGWRADFGITTAARASMETDDLTVRGRMRVYELLIQQIRATNGSVFVSSASKVVSTTASSNPLWTVNGSQLKFNGSNATLTTTLYTINTAAAGDTARELYHGFLYGDLIRCQQVQWNGSSFAGVILSNLEVTKVTNLYTYQGTLVSGDAPATGYDYVRVGNSVDTSRQGAIYLTSDDAAAPFIDIVDGITSHAAWNTPGAIKVRVGKLTGISDAAFGGTLDGYGIYASRAYIKGKIVVTGGNLGGLAAADVNANTTQILGGRITTGSLAAICADLGTVTAGSIVVGSTNKLWLNDASDGVLAVGGSTKAAAPFHVSAAGHLDATDATFGDLNIDTAGAYVDAPNVTYGLATSGYKFKYGGGVAAGLSATYDGLNAALYVDNNASGTNGDTPKYNIGSTLLLRSMANGAGKAATAGVRAIHGATSTILELTNDGTSRTVKFYGTALTMNDNTVWHAANDGASSGLDADLLDGNHASAFAVASNPTFASYVRLTSISTPTFPNGGTEIYLTSGNRLVIAYYNGTNIKYRWLNLAGTDAAWNYQLDGTPPA